MPRSKVLSRGARFSAPGEGAAPEESGEAAAPRRRLGEHSLTLTALVGAAYVLAYGFYLILSRILPIGQFALAGAYLAVLGVVTLASAAVIFAAAKEVAAAPEGGRPARAAQVRAAYLRPMRWLSVGLGAAAAALLAFSFEAALLLATCAVVPLRDLHCGLLNGLRMNGRFGAVVFSEAALRVGLAGAALLVPFAWVALAAWLVSYILGLALGLLLLPAAARAKSDPVPVRKSTVESVLLRLPQVSFLNTDVLLVALLFGAGTETALYVAAALLSRIPFYLLTPIAMGELPTMVGEHGAGPRSRRMLLLTLVGSAALTVPLALLPGFALDVGFGGAFSGGAPVLFFLAITAFLLIQVHGLSLALFAGGKGRVAALTLAAAAALEVALILLFGPSSGTAGVAAATAISAAVALVPLLVFDLNAARKWQSAV